MLKKQYKELFEEVRAMSLDKTCAPFLASLCFGYRQLLLLSYVAPAFTEPFGEAAKPVLLANSMQKVIDRLADNLNNELPYDEWARNIVYLLEAIVFQYDEGQLLTARNSALDFISSVGPLTDDGTGIVENVCKMCCYRFYFESSKEAAGRAKAMIDGWMKELPPSGIWEGMALGVALSRLEAIILFSNTVDYHVYRPAIEQLMQRYSRMPGIEQEIRFLPLLDESGLFNDYREQALRTLNYLMQVKDKQQLMQAIRFYLLGIYWYQMTAKEGESW